jgi:hypothetical protein
MMDLLTNNNRPAGDGLISKTVDGIHELSKYSPEIGFALSTLSIYHGDSTNPNFGEAMSLNSVDGHVAPRWLFVGNGF